MARIPKYLIQSREKERKVKFHSVKLEVVFEGTSFQEQDLNKKM